MEPLQKERLSREEWLAWRRKGIGSSDAAAIMGESPWATPFEVFLEKTGRIAGRRRSPWEWRAMQRGIRLEAAARRCYENWTGIEMPSRMLVHPEYPQLRATLDGINRNAGRWLEIKAPGKRDHAVALRRRIPKKYVWQCVHIAMVANTDLGDYWSYDGWDGVAVPFDRDFKRERILKERELDMWDCIQRDRWPPPKFFVPSNVIQFRR